MNKPLASREATLTSYESPTKQKGMDSSATHWQIPVLHGHFIFTINQHWRNGPRKATHHCILIIWECLTNLKTSSTIAGLIICICLPGFQRQHGHISNKVRISGPTRKSGHGLPKCVIQEEVKNAEAIHAVWGTVKAQFWRVMTKCQAYWQCHIMTRSLSTSYPQSVKRSSGYSVRRKFTVWRQNRWKQ